jgi:hypothetical protein
MAKTLAELDAHWKQQFREPTNNPRPDALARAMNGVLPVEADPMRDPMFMPAEQADQRERVMREINDWSTSTDILAQGGYVTIDGREYRINDVQIWRDRTAYDLLSRGVDVRTIAAGCFLSIDEVKAIAAKYNLPTN